MRSALLLLVGGLLVNVLGLSAQTIAPGGIVDAAGFRPAIAQGSIFSIFGTGFGSRLDAVSIRVFHQEGMAFTATPIHVSPSQINAILPLNTPIGLVSVTVNQSNAEAARVVRSQFGIFAVTNYVSGVEQPLNTPATPAVPGQIVILWGTGLGPAPSTDPFEATVGGRPAQVDYRGPSGCCRGADQVNLRIPDDAPQGCAVPVSVKSVNGVFSNVVSVAIGECAGGSAARSGEIAIEGDRLTAWFSEGAPARLPTLGFCAAAAGPPAGTLSAGSFLTVSGPQGQVSVPRDGAGRYVLTGSFLSGPGTYAVDAPGGPDIGAFRATITGGSTFAWTSTSGDRFSGLTLNWTGGNPQREIVLISGPRFTCAAGVAGGTFTVPPALLAGAPLQGEVQVAATVQSEFTAPGLDRGVLRHSQPVTRLLTFGDPPLVSSPVRLPNGQTILAELALTDLERQRGLMQRPSLSPDRGMLFMYGRPGFLSFWMYRTLIPLDIIWLDQNRRIVFISANTPPCQSALPDACPTYGGQQPAQYVLEIGAGLAAHHGLRLGDLLDF